MNALRDQSTALREMLTADLFYRLRPPGGAHRGRGAVHRLPVDPPRLQGLAPCLRCRAYHLPFRPPGPPFHTHRPPGDQTETQTVWSARAEDFSRDVEGYPPSAEDYFQTSEDSFQSAEGYPRSAEDYFQTSE